MVQHERRTRTCEGWHIRYSQNYLKKKNKMILKQYMSLGHVDDAKFRCLTMLCEPRYECMVCDGHQKNPSLATNLKHTCINSKNLRDIAQIVKLYYYYFTNLIIADVRTYLRWIDVCSILYTDTLLLYAMPLRSNHNLYYFIISFLNYCI